MSTAVKGYATVDLRPYSSEAHLTQANGTKVVLELPKGLCDSIYWKRVFDQDMRIPAYSANKSVFWIDRQGPSLYSVPLEGRRVTALPITRLSPDGALGYFGCTSADGGQGMVYQYNLLSGRLALIEQREGEKPIQLEWLSLVGQEALFTVWQRESRINATFGALSTLTLNGPADCRPLSQPFVTGDGQIAMITAWGENVFMVTPEKRWKLILVHHVHYIAVASDPTSPGSTQFALATRGAVYFSTFDKEPWCSNIAFGFQQPPQELAWTGRDLWIRFKEERLGQVRCDKALAGDCWPSWNQLGSYSAIRSCPVEIALFTPMLLYWHSVTNGNGS